MIKDSGNRREFETGAVRDIDEAKGRCDLLPLGVVAELTNKHIFNKIDGFQNSGNTAFLRQAFQIFSEMAFENVESALLEVSIHFKEGARKYGEYNWQKGIPTHCYVDSAVRHLLKYLRKDDDERHDRAFLWNIACCIWTCENMPELNDYDEEKETIVAENQEYKL